MVRTSINGCCSSAVSLIGYLLLPVSSIAITTFCLPPSSHGMRYIGLLLILILIFCSPLVKAQVNIDSLDTWLQEASKATSTHKTLWGVDLYGPILLVDSEHKLMYANSYDSTFAPISKGLYVGTLPNELNIANTAVTWNNQAWAMIMLPLPQNKNERLNLICHELFHRAQPQQGLKVANADNLHLDTQEGRILLRLELNALQHAVTSTSREKMLQHVTNALMFRQHRQTHFPGSDSTENLLELNEGLAEFTGLMLSKRSMSEMERHIASDIETFSRSKNFVRSFAYHTIPAYGLLTLKYFSLAWLKSVDANANLLHLISKEINRPLKIVPDSVIERIGEDYGLALIKAEEDLRRYANEKLVDSLKRKFIESPSLKIRLINMNISFDPSTVISLGEYGTVYPAITVKDIWGTLVVSHGALLGAGWDKITITAPIEIKGRSIHGKGWRLELNDDKFEVEQLSDGNYQLRKR
jgi:hypothetical protein